MYTGVIINTEIKNIPELASKLTKLTLEVSNKIKEEYDK